jgi:hypothetical protein
VEEKGRVKIKVIAALENIHFTQALNYLDSNSSDIGLLLDFGSPSLEKKG